MIIITGGAGFIGSNLLAGLEGYTKEDLVVCDTMGYDDKWRNISKRPIRDIVQPEKLFNYLDDHRKEITTIFHLGAIASTTENNTDLIIEHNFVLSRQLWKWCAREEKRLIYSSTYATYGDGEYGFNDQEEPDYLAQLKPLNPYGWSKHLFDRRVVDLLYGPQSGREPIPPQWAGLKLFNVYGPNEYHKGDQMSVLCKLYPQIAAGASARLFKSHHPDYEDGGQLRDFIWVGDVVEVLLWLYDNPEINGLFNVGTGKARSFKDLAEAAFEAVGIEPKINFIEMPQELRGKYQYFTEADISKLRAKGFEKEFTPLEQGINTYIQTYLNNRDPYR